MSLYVHTLQSIYDKEMIRLQYKSESLLQKQLNLD